MFFDLGLTLLGIMDYVVTTLGCSVSHYRMQMSGFSFRFLPLLLRAGSYEQGEQGEPNAASAHPCSPHWRVSPELYAQECNIPNIN